MPLPFDPNKPICPQCFEDRLYRRDPTWAADMHRCRSGHFFRKEPDDNAWRACDYNGAPKRALEEART